MDTQAAIDVLRRSAEKSDQLQSEVERLTAKLANLESRPRDDDAFDPIVNTKQVIAMTGLRRSTIYARMTKGRFPQRVGATAEGEKSLGWRRSEIERWLNEL